MLRLLKALPWGHQGQPQPVWWGSGSLFRCSQWLAVGGVCMGLSLPSGLTEAWAPGSAASPAPRTLTCSQPVVRASPASPCTQGSGPGPELSLLSTALAGLPALVFLASVPMGAGCCSASNKFLSLCLRSTQGPTPVLSQTPHPTHMSPTCPTRLAMHSTAPGSDRGTMTLGNSKQQDSSLLTTLGWHDRHPVFHGRGLKAQTTRCHIPHDDTPTTAHRAPRVETRCWGLR